MSLQRRGMCSCRCGLDSTALRLPSILTIRFTHSTPSLAMAADPTTSGQASKISYFFVYAPDYTDADGMKRRMAVREKHIQNAHTYIESGFIS